MKLTEEQLNTFPKEAIVAMYVQLYSNFDLLKAQNDQLLANNKELLEKVSRLEESVTVLTSNRFGRKTEKQTEGQLSFAPETMTILNEAEKLLEDKVPEEPAIEEVVIHRYRRTKGDSRIDLGNLEQRPEPTSEFDDETLARLFPNGYDRLKDKTHHEIQYQKGGYFDHIYSYAVYRDKKNGKILEAPHPQWMLPHTVSSPSFMAAALNAKYVNAVPLNRYSVALQQYGLNIQREILANWVIKVGDRYFYLIYNAMHKALLKSTLINCDETPFIVVHNGRGPNSKDYMWVYHSSPGHGTPPIYMYEYCETRKTDNPLEFLKGFHGTLMTDGYQVYHSLEKQFPDQFKVAGCWAHAKRKFSEIRKTGKETSRSAVCIEGEKRIQAIYHVEHMFANAAPDEKLKNRQILVKPLVDAYFAWVKSTQPKVDPASNTGKALQYSINQEKFLRAFLDDSQIPLDNNDAERSIRTFCTGRKNWQICDSKNGARVSGIIYSIAETAKANGLIPFEYFKYVLEQMPQHQKLDDLDYIDDLLPWSDKLPAECHKQTKTQKPE